MDEIAEKNADLLGERLPIVLGCDVVSSLIDQTIAVRSIFHGPNPR